MGVRLEPALTFGRLAQKIEESRIPNRFNYKDRSSIIPLDYTLFSESDGTRAFLSKVNHLQVKSRLITDNGPKG